MKAGNQLPIYYRKGGGIQDKMGNKLPETNLKKLRNKMGLSQHDVAIKVNATDKSYRSWENGKSFPDTFHLKNLAQLFGVSTDYILGLTEYKNIGNEEISKITGLSDVSIEFLRYLNYSSNHYVYDHPGNVNKQTIAFINRVLEAEGANLSREEDGDTLYRSTLFRTMELYVTSAWSKGTISEIDEATGGMKYATGESILFVDPNMPDVYDISKLRREALMSQIRVCLDNLRKREEEKEHG